MLLLKQALPGSIPISDMAQKVATACKMKSRQETTSLGQIATVTAKPSISDMGPPLGRASLNSNPEALYKDIWYMSL